MVTGTAFNSCGVEEYLHKNIMFLCVPYAFQVRPIAHLGKKYLSEINVRTGTAARVAATFCVRFTRTCER